MYIINEYQLVALSSDVYLTNFNIGAKIPNPKLAQILARLKEFPKSECTEEQLNELANQFQVDVNALKKVLIQQINVLKPMLIQKIPLIYINSDDQMITKILQETLENEFTVNVVSEEIRSFQDESMVIFFRKNYSNAAFKTLYPNLGENVYLVTAGVLHKLLIIDNLYVAGSGLPTHFSNLHQMMAYLHSDIPATKNNWLLFYREIIKNSLDEFPDPEINSCQRAYVAYCLYQFISQYTNLWNAPTPMDQVNCFWQADLTNFTVHSEAALHSPFSEYDMKLNLKNLEAQEII
jgi:McbB family protein